MKTVRAFCTTGSRSTDAARHTRDIPCVPALGINPFSSLIAPGKNRPRLPASDKSAQRARPPRTVPLGVSRVLQRGTPLQILGAIIRFGEIDMVHLGQVIRITQKRLRYNAVNQRGSHRSLPT